jgi:hypothetical protein
MCADVERQQRPLSNFASLAYCSFNRFSLLRSKYQRLRLKLLFVVPMPFCVWRNIWGAIAVVKAIYRAALVAMKPSTVGAKGDEVSERNVGVVPHDEDEETECEMGACWQSGSKLSMYSATLKGRLRIVDPTLPRYGTDLIATIAPHVFSKHGIRYVPGVKWPPRRVQTDGRS